jgi:nitroimidazol reductase NimA-like FMN-containing flavoprotein (pyridoxamine 5'-phosphate oxidase superfamily)
MSDALLDWWEPAYRGGRIEVLEAAECARLLVTTNIGRLGFSVDDGQRIVPINFVVADRHLVFRTAPHTEAARCIGRPVAFEVDSFDEFLLSGWNVLVSGTAEQLPMESLRAMDVGETPEPWAEGVRPVYVRLALDQMAGRRVHAA